MSEEFSSLADLINKAFVNIKVDDVKKAATIYDIWKKVLLRIKGRSNPHEGENLAAHTRIVDLKNGVLLVEADHPGWIELLQLHKKYILTGMKMENPSLEINTLAMKLAGKKGEIYNYERKEEDLENSQKIAMKKIEEQEKKLNSMGFELKNIEKKELPPELQGLFSQLKADMLTNSSKK